MIPPSFISEFLRKAERLRQTQAAISLEREQAVRNADIQSAAFVSNIVCPVLHRAEHRLTEASLPAVATDRIHDLSARTMLTVNLSGDGVPAVLAFEAWLGSAVPRLRWMNGSRVHTLIGFDRGVVERIVDDFVNSTLQQASEDTVAAPGTNQSAGNEVTVAKKSIWSQAAVSACLKWRNKPRVPAFSAAGPGH